MTARTLFAALVACQAAHSIEETTFGLYNLLPYIYWADNVVAGGALGLFIIGNTAFVAFGVWCYLARVRPGAPGAAFFVWLWALIEIFNGVLHPSWSLLVGSYIPGTVTAPVLLALALALLWRWNVEERGSNTVLPV